MYLMPCGGGSVVYEVMHENVTLYKSDEVDSLDIVKVASPNKGQYKVRISTDAPTIGYSAFPEQRKHYARMVEVFLSKGKKRFPLPKLPGRVIKIFFL